MMYRERRPPNKIIGMRNSIAPDKAARLKMIIEATSMVAKIESRKTTAPILRITSAHNAIFGNSCDFESAKIIQNPVAFSAKFAINKRATKRKTSLKKS